MLEHLLLRAKKAGITDFVFVVGYHGETVRNYFGEGERWGVTIQYVNQRKQMGTAHALKMAEGLVDDEFLLCNGDVLLEEADISRVLAQEGMALSLVEVSNPRDLGVVEVEGDRVVRLHEKVAHPPSRLANAGLYHLTRPIFDAIARTEISPRGEYEITDSLQLLINSGHRISWQRINSWLDLSYPWDLLEANASLILEGAEMREGTVEGGVVIKGYVTSGKGTQIGSNSYIIGPVVICEDCEIGPNCYLRPATAIGDGCHIGSSVEIKNSIIMKGSNVPHHNYVGDSVVGEGCNFGAGTKIANLRLDKKEVQMGNTNIRRGKLGAIVGDRVQTGINACINVGSLIGSDTFIGPGAMASGHLLPGTRIF
jgi:bifunctional UDP-N-acetylglucosamine pyrophosphorylase/glucosamine-1-phosphate N-acetyltransferase